MSPVTPDWYPDPYGRHESDTGTAHAGRWRCRTKGGADEDTVSAW